MAAFLQSVRFVLHPETVPLAQGKYVAAGFPCSVRVLEDWQKVLKLSTALILLHHERNESSPNEQGFKSLSRRPYMGELAHVLNSGCESEVKGVRSDYVLKQW